MFKHSTIKDNIIKFFDIKHNKRRCFLWTLILFTTSLFIINYFIGDFITNLRIVPPQAKYYHLSTKSQKEKIKTILYWNTFFGSKDMGLGLGREAFKNCPVSACIATSNKSFLSIEQFDAIIFHGPTYTIRKNNLPNERSLHQKYIFLSWESPYNTNFDNRVNNHFYNWTMTYRRDSDIHCPYKIVQEIVKNYTEPTYEVFKQKKKMVAWFVSNCATPGSIRRMKYAKNLSKFIEVDIYGFCGNLTCSLQKQWDCYKMVELDYKFYLSFENSMCPDYVTEKLFNILTLDVIPVVMGYAEYGAIAPPRSVINVDDFDGPKALAQYLLELSDNYEEYVQYLEWKQNYGICDSAEYTLCQLCDMLHGPMQYSSYEDIKEWFFGFKCYL